MKQFTVVFENNSTAHRDAEDIYELFAMMDEEFPGRVIELIEADNKKVYVKPQIEDQKIEIEDSIASSGDDIYNVREIFK